MTSSPGLQYVCWQKPIGGFAPGKTTTRVGVMLRPRRSSHVWRDRLAEREDSLRIDVVRQIVVDLPLDLLADVPRKREIGLAEVAPDHALCRPSSTSLM